MSVKVGVYEFFARMIPGGFYLFTVIYISVLSGLISFDLQTLNNLSVVTVLVLAGFSYILGFVLDVFAKMWHRLFKAKGHARSVLEEFKKKHMDWDLKIGNHDWRILLAFLRREGAEVVTELESFDTTCILLRNVSFNCIVLSLIQIVQFLQTGYIWNLILCVIFVVASIASGQQGEKFRRYYFKAILEAVVARRLDLSEIITHRQQIMPKTVEAPPLQADDKQSVKQTI